MSELKELSWDVQETIQPLPFEALERRAIRRRHRRQALTGAGVVAAVTIAVLAAVLPLGNVTGTEKPPTAGTPASIPVDQAAEKLIRDKKSGAAAIAFGTPTRWASVWSSPQPGYTWNYAAVLSRDGVRTTAPVRKNPYFVLRAGDEALALSMPTSMKGSDPSWAQSVMVRLTDQGRVEKTLRWAPPTSEFADGDVLLASGTLRALNLETGTLREVKIPGIDNAYEPYRDTTGRWWLVGAKNSGVGNIYWTDDSGKTWDHSVISPGRMGGRLGVSPDGRTMVAIPGSKPGTPGEPGAAAVVHRPGRTLDDGGHPELAVPAVSRCFRQRDGARALSGQETRTPPARCRCGVHTAGRPGRAGRGRRVRLRDAVQRQPGHHQRRSRQDLEVLPAPLGAHTFASSRASSHRLR